MTEEAALDAQDFTASLVRALVLYSLGEFQGGHATTLRVLAGGRSFSVADNGRGHAIERTVGGLPYLKFVYTHLDYPFEQQQGAPLQLHAIGISLVNMLCSDLTVTTHKRDVTLRMSFRHGQLRDHGVVDVKSQQTGNTIVGNVSPPLQKEGVDTGRLRQWLLALLAASPGLKLFFNDVELGA